jgi:GAF domain-containing protein
MAAFISGWSMLKRQTVSIANIKLDRRTTQDLYESTFVQSLVMTPICTDPPVGTLGAYGGQVYAAQPHEVATVKALAAAVGAAIRRVRAAPQHVEAADSNR